MEHLGRHTGLVLEGGGMRGVFTSGVLDALMKHEMYFPYVVAVSAGACNGLSYMSRQPRRARFSNIDMLRRYGYLSLKHLLVQGSIFDPNILYERFPAEIVPFDYETYARNPAVFEMVTTNLLTGMNTQQVHNHDLGVMTLGGQKVNLSLSFQSLVHNIAQLLQGGRRADAYLGSQVADAGHKTHPHDILDVDVITNEHLFVVVNVDNAHQCVAVLPEVIQKR